MPVEAHGRLVEQGKRREDARRGERPRVHGTDGPSQCQAVAGCHERGVCQAARTRVRLIRPTGSFTFFLRKEPVGLRLVD